jgi:hypothetical protein
MKRVEQCSILYEIREPFCFIIPKLCVLEKNPKNLFEMPITPSSENKFFGYPKYNGTDSFIDRIEMEDEDMYN